MRNEVKVLFVLVSVIFMTGTAAAEGVITVLPTSGPNVVDGTIQIPVGTDAYESVGLAVQYENFGNNRKYDVKIVRDSDGETVYGPLTGDIGRNVLVELHWSVPPNSQETYTVVTSGLNKKNKIIVAQNAPVSPIPELGTVVLTSAGLVGLLLVSRRYRQN